MGYSLAFEAHEKNMIIIFVHIVGVENITWIIKKSKNSGKKFRTIPVTSLENGYSFRENN